MSGSKQIALLRIVAQRIAGPKPTTILETVQWLGATQAQDRKGAVLSLALRTDNATANDVDAACNNGEIVRSWPMRGTLHYLAAEDLPWVLTLGAPRIIAGAATRRAGLGIDAAAIDRAAQAAVNALTGGRRLTREQLMTTWTESGLDVTGQRGYHLLGHLAMTGVVCFGPIDNGVESLVLVDEWIPNRKQLDRDEAIAEWAERYFRSHGPATLADFVRWSGVTIRDARTAVTAGKDKLTMLTADGIDYYLDPVTPELLELHRNLARGVFLLPGFDELILGYADRTATLATEFADLIVPGGNGMFRATIIDNGRVVGTWKHGGTKTKRRLEATPFSELNQRVTQRLPRVYSALPR